MKSKWKEEELRNWLSSVSGPTLLLVLWGFVFRIYMLYYFGYLSRDVVAAFSILFVGCLTEHQLTARTSSPTLKRIGCYVYLELMQICLYLVTIYVDPEYSHYYAVTGTMLCLTCQLSIHMSAWVVVLLIAKLFGSWLLIGIYVGDGRMRPFFPYMPFLVMLFLTVKICNYRQRLAIERMDFCESLIVQERRMHSILAAFPDGLLVLTTDFEVKTWNQELLRLMSVSEDAQVEDGIRNRLKELVYVQGMKKFQSKGEMFWKDIVAMAEGCDAPITLGTTMSAGKYLEWKGSIGAWDQDKVCILTVRDSTDWIQMQEQIKRESASKTALLRSVSHELRTPTNAIINLVREILEEGAWSVHSAEDLSLVSICTQFLLSMINDLLDYSKLIAGQFALVKTKFALRQVLQQSVQLFEPNCKVKHLDLNLNIDPLLPEVAYSDPNRIKQVLLNLLSNAVKFTMNGNIRVMALFTANSKLKVVVEDTGIGIAKQKQGKLFKLFGKLEGNEVLNPQGSGLGLSIANALAMELGKKPIELESEAGNGAAFSFYVDIIEGSNEKSPMSSESRTGEVPDEVTNYIRVPQLLRSEHCFARQQPLADILLVDDADFNRLVLRRMLHSMELGVDEASTGLQALIQVRKAYSERGHLYKLVLMDLNMPEMDGLTAVREIQNLVVQGELPLAPRFIACSAYSSAEDKELCYRAGMSAYLEKPIFKENLLAVITSFL